MRLRRSDVSRPGYTRRRAGRGWVYLDAAGAQVTDPATLDRIRALVIPPAWTSVWICPLANGHIQAVGTDAAGRRQYRYHDAWRVQRDLAKHEHVLDFAARLPAAREQVLEHLCLPGVPQDKALACAARLLDLGFFRIGSEEYAESNNTFGLATLRKEHVTLRPGGVIVFDYPAKSGKRRIQSIADEAVLGVVQTLKRRRGGGPELLAYRRPGGWSDVKSEDVNGYLRRITGGDFTAKDFRTWNATVLAAVALAVSAHAAPTPTARKRAVTRAVREVADYLGNTPAVCRASYIDPRVIDLFHDGVTVIEDLERLGSGASFGQPATQGPLERAVLDLLRTPVAERRAG